MFLCPYYFTSKIIQCGSHTLFACVNSDTGALEKFMKTLCTCGITNEHLLRGKIFWPMITSKLLPLLRKLDIDKIQLSEIHSNSLAIWWQNFIRLCILIYIGMLRNLNTNINENAQRIWVQINTQSKNF